MKSVGSTLMAAVGLTALLGACTDSGLPTETTFDRNLTPLTSRSGGLLFHRYVAIGTSITMGVQSDGVFEESQKTSWVAQLAAMAGEELTLPLIESPGCGSPLLGPLSLGKRLSGEPAPVKQICAPLKEGITLPAGNVAVDGARTDDALFSKVGTYSGVRGGQYERVLPPGMSQVDAMLAQNPKFVSVELGGNDIIGARSGLYIPAVGGTVVPLEAWKGFYTQLLDAVQSTAKRAILVGLVDDAMEFPGFRTGFEIYQARGLFAAMGVTVTDACGNANRDNVLFVPVLIPLAVANRSTLTCENSPSVVLGSDGRPRPGTPDFILAPEEIAALNAQVVQMNAFIREQAAARGWAYVELEVIYGRADAKPPFNPIALMTSMQPYGPYVSLDGIHPNAAGAKLLADAAAAALNARYRLAIGDPTVADEEGYETW